MRVIHSVAGVAVGGLICGKCSSEKVRRAHLRYYDLPLLALFVPIRCRDCHTRSYIGRYSKDVPALSRTRW